ncbi:MAG: hypothetical protein COV57_02565 [Candidatus Liptonbacteria bacterium CG11_big_fil_rev_8_21_14_0_20_35_14]|uniref:Uncharacterized protein n=1 Tax=Candidatus Liptonbacteria bacterium CG11_big_fil_rev_8_21_14_0_20_35_14 TaxID=1974634 RepID=A0A2H0N7C2_9BACT|nr:MAG: hypothetical protein COV57_02565 [Candidatus Liptonbacteria bacterium CG11_big_fil_rev_8_21_14_0_20_35_14]
MSKVSNVHKERNEELTRILLDIHEATGLPLNKFLLKIEMDMNRWNQITIGNESLTLQEAFKISTEIGVAIDYFVHCCVHTGVIAERFENYNYSPFNARNEFTKKIIALTEQVRSEKGLHRLSNQKHPLHLAVQ